MPNNITNPADLASFPNSRIRPRKATRAADTYHILASSDGTIGALDTTVTPPQNTDRGSITTQGNVVVAEENENRTYLTLRNIDAERSVRYGYVDRNTLADDGFELRAGDSVDLEAPTAIYVVGIATDNLQVRCCIDFGEG